NYVTEAMGYSSRAKFPQKVPSTARVAAGDFGSRGFTRPRVRRRASFETLTTFARFTQQGCQVHNTALTRHLASWVVTKCV
ncbi:MAG: hypothetical protein WBM31_03195, partial [Pseudolabrys sp.]